MRILFNFENDEDFIEHIDKISLIETYKSSIDRQNDIIPTLIIDPIVVRNTVCNKMKFYIDEITIPTLTGFNVQDETVLYLWGTDPYSNEDVKRFKSDHPIYKKFEYLLDI